MATAALVLLLIGLFYGLRWRKVTLRTEPGDKFTDSMSALGKESTLIEKGGTIVDDNNNTMTELLPSEGNRDIDIITTSSHKLKVSDGKSRDES